MISWVAPATAGRGTVGEMAGRTVQLRLAGQTYRVVTTASDEELARLVSVVEERLAKVVPPGRTTTPQQALLLAAMALAHDLEQERRRAAAIAAHARAALARLLGRVEAALQSGHGTPPPASGDGVERLPSGP
jgi:cell division protein ZapA